MREAVVLSGGADLGVVCVCWGGFGLQVGTHDHRQLRLVARHPISIHLDGLVDPESRVVTSLLLIPVHSRLWQQLTHFIAHFIILV